MIVINIFPMIIIITIVTLGGIMIKIHTHDTIIHATDRQEFLQAFAKAPNIRQKRPNIGQKRPNTRKRQARVSAGVRKSA
jgi:hypothetical protein